MNLIEIGRIHTPFSRATGTPIQPCCAAGAGGFIKIKSEHVAGLKDLAGFDRIWLLFWCHRAADAKMLVVPYRDTIERGLFATRAPARPNPIGLSCVRLLGLESDTLRIGEVDILDDTPLLDIKPYVPQYDNYPVSRCGWVDSAPDRRGVADDRFDRK
jgi:tRNA-Thr(GGU) m(6)t(6)A37 methyltransferase TsaA